MRSLKSGLFAIAFSGVLGTVAVVGCSADGGGADIEENVAPTEPASSGSTLPPKGEPVDPPDAGKDAGKKDSGPKAEAGVDAGPPPPVEGTACPTLNTITQKNCGACGKAETVCLDDGTGKGKWSPYGGCTNELAGGCIPGTSVQEDCGNCGKVTKTCTQYCAYTSGSCTGQPANSCPPASVEYTNAGCAAQSYRERTCAAACTWGNYTAGCAAPNNANKLTISGTVAGTAAGTFTLSASKMGPKVSGGCPGSVSSTKDHPYEIVEIKNNTTKTATVSAWLSGTPAIDTVMWAYNTNLPPQDDTARKACKWGVNDFCPSSLPCTTDDDWSGLTGATQSLVIPPGQVVLVQFAAYYPNSSATYVTTGAATLTVRTDVLTP